jgi:hypothetical protein
MAAYIAAMNNQINKKKNIGGALGPAADTPKNMAPKRMRNNAIIRKKNPP